MTQSSSPGIDLLAAEWAVRLSVRALTPEERRELDSWLAADARHRGALLRARSTWADLDRLAALSGQSPSEQAIPPLTPADSLHDSTLLPVEPTQWNAKAEVRAKPFIDTKRRAFLAASIAAAFFSAAGGIFWLRQRNTYINAIGQIRRVVLSDGSRMTLNTATEATVRFDETRREIDLTSGEGLFQVAKEARRPFIVRAGSVSVRAVGTVFTVKAVDQRVDVTVTEGVVELVDDSPSGHGLLRRISANEQASVLETRQVEFQKIASSEAARRLAWREGMVDFAGDPLSHAVEEINRHNHRQIVIDDPALASRPVVGIFKANDPAGFAATVAAALGAHEFEDVDGIHLQGSATP